MIEDQEGVRQLINDARQAAHFDGFLLGIFVGLCMAIAGLIIAIGSI